MDGCDQSHGNPRPIRQPVLLIDQFSKGIEEQQNLVYRVMKFDHLTHQDRVEVHSCLQVIEDLPRFVDLDRFRIAPPLLHIFAGPIMLLD